MCGIFALLNASYQEKSVEIMIEQFEKGKNRGPENSTLQHHLQLTLGFHRLAINGLNEQSNQPLVYEGIILICNGEIYNYKNLYEHFASKQITKISNSDCEVIIHLYINYGIEQTLLMLDGVYSFVLYDSVQNKIFVARDPMGVRPLYKLHNNTHIHGFASELKCLEYYYNLNHLENRLEQFEPGTYSVFSYGRTKWEQIVTNKVYYLPTFSYMNHIKCYDNSITHYLYSAVEKRCNTTERPVACLLSGGLDSSLIAALVSKYFHNINPRGKYNKAQSIETYSIGLQNSEDIKYARMVADHIASNHTEIIVTEREMFDAIPEVIKAIESYDTTTVRASIGNYLIGKYISTHSEAKVIFNGDGADELFGGYLYMYNCLDDIEYDKETRRLLKDIHMFDVLRSDKSISSNGLEPRTPFLDKTFVNYVLSIPSNVRNHNNFRKHNNYGKPEKYLLRESFSEFTDGQGKPILPNEILWRKKEAFSDGVSSKGRSLFEILQEFIAEHYNNLQGEEFEYSPCIDLEKKYYKSIFDKEFPNCEHILPYYWMPKYTNSTDPSARTLANYK